MPNTADTAHVDVVGVANQRATRGRGVSARFGKRRGAVKAVTGIEQNGSGNVEVHAVVHFHQNGDVLPGASPDGDVTFHIIGTVLQQARQGRRVCKVRAVAESLGVGEVTVVLL